MKPKLAVCPKTAVRSQMRKKWECIFATIFHKNGFWCRNFENLTLNLESALPRYHVCEFPGKTNKFDFFSPNLPQNEFWRHNFKDLTLDSESAPPRCHVCQFSGKAGSFVFFRPNLSKNGFWVINSEN